MPGHAPTTLSLADPILNDEYIYIDNSEP